MRNLRTFCAVVEHGGFGGAQAVLGASQSVISTHLKDLEVKLGLTLCSRGRGGFAVTEKGEEVYAEAKRLLAAVELCEANLGTLRRVLTGHLRLGLVDSEADNPDLPLHRAIRRFRDVAGDVRLTLEVGTPEFLGKALQTGDIHAAIGPFPNRQPNITYWPFYVEEHGLYCGRAHPLFDRDPATVGLAEVAACPMAVRPYLQRAELAGLPDAVAMASVSNMEAQAILINSGCYLGWLPLHFARKWVARGEMRRIDWLGLSWQSQFYVAHPSSPHDLVQRFLAVLAEDFGSLR
ncbi:MAG: LysR family transcriptional regulator [Rhodobacteraceae bacterium]|nr:MAG: LysR family transcriptional regulator [Paracoccaceae bacterium]